jgi:uncharacterized delta-60 repeat protein
MFHRWIVGSGAVTLAVIAGFACNSGSSPLNQKFGVDGVQTLSFGSQSQGTAVVRDNNKNLVVGGLTLPPPGKGDGNADALFARLRFDGQLDNRFGSRGILALPFSAGPVTNLVIQPEDGKIIGAYGTAGALKLIRLSVDGLMDHSFGADGVVDLTLGPQGHSAAALRFVDGWIRIAINLDFGSVAAARLGLDGSVDKTYGDQGFAVLPIAEATAVIDHLGRTVFSGRRDGKTVLMRLKEDGAADLQFGENGIVETRSNLDVRSFQRDGKLLTTFAHRDRDLISYGIVRVNEDGTLDAHFGDRGEVLSGGGKEEAVAALALQWGEIAIIGNYQMKEAFIDLYKDDGKPKGDGSSRLGISELRRVEAGIILSGTRVALVGSRGAVDKEEAAVAVTRSLSE